MLGKGLESLIPQKKQAFQDDDVQRDDVISAPVSFDEPESAPIPEPSITEPAPDITTPVFQIETERVTINPYQPRKVFDETALRELAASIRELGMLQPIVVTKQEEAGDQGIRVTYQLIAGHRRLLASKMLGLRTIPAIVRQPKRDTEPLELAIVENIQRADLNIIETARAYARLSDEFGLTQREIATRLGKSREAVANALRLLSLSTEIQDAVMEGKLTESHARLLLQVTDPMLQNHLFERMVSEQLSVRSARSVMERGIQKSEPSRDRIRPVRTEDLQMKAMEKRLSSFLGAPVKVDISSTGGKIVIHFYSPEEVYSIVDRFKIPEE
jgi:ParB family transcriptional regulator, chromosome partitioning protein